MTIGARCASWVALVLAAMLGAAPVLAQTSKQNWARCEDNDPDLSIGGCTAIIQAGGETNVNLAIAFTNRGIAYNDKRQYDRAIQDFDQAIRLNPSHADAWASRGNAYQEKGEHDKAIADFDRVLRLTPNDASAFYNRGNGYFGKGQYDRAIQDYDQASRLRPNHASTHYNRGLSYERTGRPEQAIPNFDQAIRLNPSHAGALNRRCWTVAAFQGRLEAALKDCNESLRLRPGNADALDSRGFVHLKSGRFDAAIADYDAALRIESTSHSLYGRGLARQRKGDQAGGAADIAAAKAIQADIAEKFVSYGVR